MSKCTGPLPEQHGSGCLSAVLLEVFVHHVKNSGGVGKLVLSWRSLFDARPEGDALFPEEQSKFESAPAGVPLLVDQQLQVRMSLLQNATDLQRFALEY